jgi:hypothetical protein
VCCRLAQLDTVSVHSLLGMLSRFAADCFCYMPLLLLLLLLQR